ncbi:M24 family metallopeptidase [Candidatus Poribacteria bacterium]|nr:M24 family metallopeptidase [Candidatus Poribacteria bacterium]MBT5533823.1 M24 family metallopeptidase [Candidatus Poribacteria bacterium]MBT5713841.1 M24 family metallopeptidase [Candidatus Poribacteria bacterium]MBT7101128.1 M24 family metallopeptidase [Candidatus Poribacteria bacterium]MBT7805707.1 M24 family metallopeptidase [Candidatus Poribacteria bacterium]
MYTSHMPWNGPKVLPVRERATLVNDILSDRLDTILPAIMGETDIDTWVIVCNEDNLDPVFRTMIPWESWTPILQILVLHDSGEGRGVERLNISRTNMTGLMDSLWEQGWHEEADQWACLRRVLDERKPKRIGVNVSNVIWAADGLTVALNERLRDTLGPELSGRIVSAEPLAIRWLETRLPRELELYHHACAIAHELIRETFSRRVVTPGVTTTDDLRWHYWQRSTDLGLPVSFSPFFRRFRGTPNIETWGEDDGVIRHGDMLHCDVGVEYLRIITDHQELAYVLKPGETDAPAGLRDGMRQAGRLQDIFTGAWQQGLTGNEILANALAQAREEGLSKPKIYSHSLSHYLHEPGPLMGLPWEQECCPGRGDVVMHYDTAYTVELNVTISEPEWDGDDVLMPMEQDAAYTQDGPVFLDGRQTEFHLI